MIGELISTGITFGVGRNAINDQFSGTAEFNNIILESGANFSGGTGGGIIFSAGTNLYNIFEVVGAVSQVYVQPGTNITTGGTPNNPTINLDGSISFDPILPLTSMHSTMSIPSPCIISIPKDPGSFRNPHPTSSACFPSRIFF